MISVITLGPMVGSVLISPALSPSRNKCISEVFPVVQILFIIESKDNPKHVFYQQPSKQLIRSRYLGHMIVYQPIKDKYFLIPTHTCASQSDYYDAISIIGEDSIGDGFRQ